MGVRMCLKWRIWVKRLMKWEENVGWDLISSIETWLNHWRSGVAKKCLAHKCKFAVISCSSSVRIQASGHANWVLWGKCVRLEECNQKCTLPSCYLLNSSIFVQQTVTLKLIKKWFEKHSQQQTFEIATLEFLLHIMLQNINQMILFHIY